MIINVSESIVMFGFKYKFMTHLFASMHTQFAVNFCDVAKLQSKQS